MTAANQTKPLRILVGLASYGNANDHYLQQLVREYRSMSFAADIVVFSNRNKRIHPDVEVVVGLPSKNPWSLPFKHKQFFVDRLEKYDFFIYSEDDILITERNIRAFLNVSRHLPREEIAGFLRTETSPLGQVNYPDMHAHFHWDATSVIVRGQYTLASFSNEHAGCYILTQDQFRIAVASGGFLLEPHEGKYDLLCTAATDPYTQCGFRKLIPISHLNEFTVAHLSNKYVGRMGAVDADLAVQLEILMQIPSVPRPTIPFLRTETKLGGAMYSKNYYEPLDDRIISAIPSGAQSVLSIGCGTGTTERWLVANGLRVAAIPLDPVISGSAAAAGVQMISGDLCSAKAKLKAQQFDCHLYSNILHLLPKPVEVLSTFAGLLSKNAVVIIQSPNILSWSTLRRTYRSIAELKKLTRFERSGVHITSVNRVRNWCRAANLEVDNVIEGFPPKLEKLQTWSKGRGRAFLASDFIAVARKQ